MSNKDEEKNMSLFATKPTKKIKAVMECQDCRQRFLVEFWKKNKNNLKCACGISVKNYIKVAV